MRGLPFFDHKLDDATYIELVRSLFATRRSMTIMGLLFLFVSLVCLSRQRDSILLALAVAGVTVSVIRGTMLFALGREARHSQFTARSGRRLERYYTWVYLAFALILGLFTAREIQVGSPDMQAVVCVLVVGYCAGVAAGVSLRPRISVAATTLAVTPTILMSAYIGDLAHLTLSLVLVTFLAGGISSMLDRYRKAVENISMRHLLGTKTKQDELTGLANRQGLSDAFESEVGRGRRNIAVHCLDLDHFKPVNDEFGHATGDLLLKLVAIRLKSLIRDCDVAARFGGDEFAVLQIGVSHGEQVALMAERIVRKLSEPYAVHARKIVVGVSVGYARVEEHGPNLKTLLIAADQALYSAKQNERGSARRALAEGSRASILPID